MIEDSLRIARERGGRARDEHRPDRLLNIRLTALAPRGTHDCVIIRARVISGNERHQCFDFHCRTSAV